MAFKKRIARAQTMPGLSTTLPYHILETPASPHSLEQTKDIFNTYTHYHSLHLPLSFSPHLTSSEIHRLHRAERTTPVNSSLAFKKMRMAYTPRMLDLSIPIPLNSQPAPTPVSESFQNTSPPKYIYPIPSPLPFPPPPSPPHLTSLPAICI